MHKLFASLTTVMLFWTLPLCALSADSPDRLAEIARQKGLPVVVQFGDGKCAPCLKQSAIIKKVRPQLDSKIIFEFVHVRKESKLTMDYKVWFTPTVVFIDAKGNELSRYTGVKNADALRKILEELGLAEF
mgnify:CR=1 FL=1